jgi:hypothetical protein
LARALAAFGFFAPEAFAVDAAFGDDAAFAGAARFGRWAAALGFAAAFALARAGVSLAAAAAGASGGVAPRAEPARLALRRAGRVRGRLVSTSRSLPFDPESLGGMARFLPIPSRRALRRPRLRRTRFVSADGPVATVAGSGVIGRMHGVPYHEGSTFEPYGGVGCVPGNGSDVLI